MQIQIMKNYPFSFMENASNDIYLLQSIVHVPDMHICSSKQCIVKLYEKSGLVKIAVATTTTALHYKMLIQI